MKTKEALADIGVLQIFQNYFRVRWLKADLKLDVKVINKLIDGYGPLDFRLPEAHAIYWAHMGLKSSNNGKNLDCERMIFQSLKSAFISGKLTQLTEKSGIHISPNIALADTVRKSYQDALKNHNENKTILAGYENFMIDAIVILYLYDQRNKAEEYLHFMRNMIEFEESNKFRKEIDEFVIYELAGDLQSISRDKVLAIIKALILQSCNSVAFGDNNRALGLELIAKKLHLSYMKKIEKGRDSGRRGLPNYDLLRRQYEAEFMETYSSIAADRFSNELNSKKSERTDRKEN